MEDPASVDAMVEEYDSIVRNSAWDIVPRSEWKSVVGSRCVYKVKKAADRSVEKYKARFVAHTGASLREQYHTTRVHIGGYIMRKNDIIYWGIFRG